MSKSILQNEKICYLCPRTYGLERHHCLAGVANRPLSQRYGIWVWLCHEHHTGKNGAQYDKDLNMLLKKESQKAFEKIYGHEKWMEIFRKNYL